MVSSRTGIQGEHQKIKDEPIWAGNGASDGSEAESDGEGEGNKTASATGTPFLFFLFVTVLLLLQALLMLFPSFYLFCVA